MHAHNELVLSRWSERSDTMNPALKQLPPLPTIRRLNKEDSAEELDEDARVDIVHALENDSGAPQSYL